MAGLLFYTFLRPAIIVDLCVCLPAAAVIGGVRLLRGPRP